MHSRETGERGEGGDLARVTSSEGGGATAPSSIGDSAPPPSSCSHHVNFRIVRQPMSTSEKSVSPSDAEPLRRCCQNTCPAGEGGERGRERERETTGCKPLEPPGVSPRQVTRWSHFQVRPQVKLILARKHA